MSDKKYIIERTTDKGYTSIEYTAEEAASILNKEIATGKVVFIDGNICTNDSFDVSDIIRSKKSICVTNKLIGG